MKISATIITFNEENNIRRAIESLVFADEIIVVDSESTDKTVEIAKSLGAEVFTKTWPGFSKQKQFAVEKTNFNFVFSLDADEEVSKSLSKKILELKKLPEHTLRDAYRIPRLSYYMNRPIRHGGWYPDFQLRLFNKARGYWKEVAVHESIEMEVGSIVEILSEEILHFSVENATHHHRMIGERYAPLAAEQMFRDGKSAGFFKIYTAGFISFFRSYFFKLGILDGLPGFAIAKFAAHHSFLKYLLLHEMTKKHKSKV